MLNDYLFKVMFSGTKFMLVPSANCSFTGSKLGKRLPNIANFRPTGKKKALKPNLINLELRNY